MINLDKLAQHRNKQAELHLYGEEDHPNRIFTIPSPVDGKNMNIVASTNDDWDHLSVSRRDRCPTWEEMSLVKRLFFLRNEVAFSLHVAEDNHVNIHPFCLHLWRPQKATIPLPPLMLV